MSLEIVKNKNKIKPDSENWYLIPTKWNDFGYRDTFTLYFKDNYLGDIKVFYLGSLHNKNLFSDIYEKINREELWFIPVDSLVHANLGFLMNAFEDEGMNINWYLDEQKSNKFFDIYYHQDKLDYIKENIDHSLLKKSIFREDEIQKLKSGLGLLKLKVIYDDPSQFSIIDFLNSKFFEKNIGQKMFSKSNLNLLRSIVSNLMYYDQSIFYETVTSYLRNYNNKINEITIKFLYDVFLTTDDDETKSCIGQIISRDVRQIINDVQAIKDRLLVDTRKVRSNTLGQYTSVRNLKFLINANDMPCLRLTNANQMNDPLEGKILQHFLKLHYVNDDYIKSNEYISSATATIDSLPM